MPLDFRHYEQTDTNRWSRHCGIVHACGELWSSKCTFAATEACQWVQDGGGAKTVPARSAAVLRGRRSANVSPCLRYNDRLAGLGFSTSASDSIISGTEREATTQL